MPEWLIVTVLGVIEGATEFLPVSSTGHLLLAGQWLGRPRSDLFYIVIQAGAVLAVLPLFPDRLGQLAQWRRSAAGRDYLVKLVACFAITAIGGAVLEWWGFELPTTPQPVAWALILGGLGFLGVERFVRNRPATDVMSWHVVAVVGLAQLVAAIFPGTSRSGASILAALALGIARPAATEFSFLVGIPTMLAAGGVRVVLALAADSNAPSEDVGMLALATLVAALVSFVVVGWLLRFIRAHTFVAFGWYRIAFGAAILLLSL